MHVICSARRLINGTYAKAQAAGPQDFSLVHDTSMWLVWLVRSLSILPSIFSAPSTTAHLTESGSATRPASLPHVSVPQSSLPALSRRRDSYPPESGLLSLIFHTTGYHVFSLALFIYNHIHPRPFVSRPLNRKSKRSRKNDQVSNISMNHVSLRYISIVTQICCSRPVSTPVIN